MKRLFPVICALIGQAVICALMVVAFWRKTMTVDLEVEIMRLRQERDQFRGLLLTVRGPYCWCPWKEMNGPPQWDMVHTEACKAARQLTGVEYGEREPAK